MVRKVSIMLTSCGYEQAMSALMLANASAMTGKEVHLFATFRGVRVVRRGFRPRFLGLLAPLTPFFEGRLRREGIGTFAEQLAQAGELGVRLYACDLCVRIGLLEEARLVEGVQVIGMPRFAEITGESDEHFVF